MTLCLFDSFHIFDLKHLAQMIRVVDLTDSKGLPGLILGICFTAIATLAVILRVISRRMIKTPLGVDDYMIIVALVRYLSTDAKYGRLNTPMNRFLALGAKFATSSVGQQMLGN